MTRVAAIVTVYQEWAHGDALGTKFFAGTSTDEGFFPPEVEVSRPPPSGSPPGATAAPSNRAMGAGWTFLPGPFSGTPLGPKCHCSESCTCGMSTGSAACVRV